MTRIMFTACLAWVLWGCSSRNIGQGADEFVFDSYKIKEGKFALLGEEFEDDDTCLAGSVSLLGMSAISSYQVDGTVRLFDVLSAAHIPVEANLFDSYVVRGDHKLPVDLCRLVQDGDMQHNIVMKGGDKLYIAGPQAPTLMVMNQSIDLPRGMISLREALALAGYKGSQIQIIRPFFPIPKIYTLHWEHVCQLPNDSLLLMPGDFVYVDSTGLAPLR